MKSILQQWNFMRALRLVLGVAILIQGIVGKDATTIVLGVLFAGMAVANVGCCGSGGCAVPTRRKVNDNDSNHYEEVTLKK